MNIPTDGRTLTLYQSKQRKYAYWYVVWQDDQGKNKRAYIGAHLPRRLQRALNDLQFAEVCMQAAIKIEMSERQLKKAEVQP